MRLQFEILKDENDRKYTVAQVVEENKKNLDKLSEVTEIITKFYGFPTGHHSHLTSRVWKISKKDKNDFKEVYRSAKALIKH